MSLRCPLSLTVFLTETHITPSVTKSSIQLSVLKDTQIRGPMYTHPVQGGWDQSDPMWFCLQTKFPNHLFCFQHITPDNYIVWVVDLMTSQ